MRRAKLLDSDRFELGRVRQRGKLGGWGHIGGHSMTLRCRFEAAGSVRLSPGWESPEAPRSGYVKFVPDSTSLTEVLHQLRPPAVDKVLWGFPKIVGGGGGGTVFGGPCEKKGILPCSGAILGYPYLRKPPVLWPAPM